MSLSKGFAALCVAGALTVLAGCGFRPLYGHDSAGHQPAIAQQFASVQIAVLPDRLGQKMRNLLIDSLHAGGAADAVDSRYYLSMTVKEAVLNLGLQENSTSTRGQVRLTVVYFLTDRQSGKTLLTETLRTSTGYNILINQFSSQLSQDDAENQGLQRVAENMTEHIALYFHDNPEPAPKAPAPK